jgi:hypothetical protein
MGEWRSPAKGGYAVLHSRVYGVKVDDIDLTRASRMKDPRLSLVRTIVELHHGQVWFENEPGHGSTFYFTLPIFSELMPGGFLIRSLQSLSDTVCLELADLQTEM